MKIKFLLSAAVALAIGATASAQSVVPPAGTPPYPTGVGPAIAGGVTTGRLPKAATDFAAKLFPGVAMVSIEEEFDSQEFDVVLANGIEIEFDAKGQWKDIDAPRGRNLDETTLKAILPEAAYKELYRLNLAASVDDVKRSAKYYKVGINSADIDDLRFDLQGTLVEIDID